MAPTIGAVMTGFERSQVRAIWARGMPRPVTVTGYVRQDGDGDATQVVDSSTRAVSSAAIGPAIGLPVYGGWVELASESPKASVPLEQAGLPDLSNGPHFFYALQWWFFGLLAVVGFFYLLYDEWRGGHSRGARSEGTEHPAVDREHHPAQE